MTAEFVTLLREGGALPEHVEALAEYGARTLEANRKFNLTGAKTPEEFTPHILDSLTVTSYVEGPLVDVGSGGGLPAIPLAIVLRVPVTLIETTVKKARHLEALIEAFGIDGVVVAERAEVAAHDAGLRERFRCGTARAVSSAPTVAELLLPFVEVGGVAIMQRGGWDDRERNALIDAGMMLGGRLEDEVLLEGERRIALVRKGSRTPERFPRRTGVPERRPLCLDR